MSYPVPVGPKPVLEPLPKMKPFTCLPAKGSQKASNIKTRNPLLTRNKRAQSQSQRRSTSNGARSLSRRNRKHKKEEPLKRRSRRKAKESQLGGKKKKSKGWFGKLDAKKKKSKGWFGKLDAKKKKSKGWFGKLDKRNRRSKSKGEELSRHRRKQKEQKSVPVRIRPVSISYISKMKTNNAPLGKRAPSRSNASSLGKRSPTMRAPFLNLRRHKEAKTLGKRPVRLLRSMSKQREVRALSLRRNQVKPSKASKVKPLGHRGMSQGNMKKGRMNNQQKASKSRAKPASAHPHSRLCL